MPTKHHPITASLALALCLGLFTAGRAEDVATGSTAAAVVAAATTPEQAIHVLQQQWAVANYQRQGKERVKALEALAEQARQTAQRFPHHAGVLTWEAICLATYAGSLQGLSQLHAIGLAKEARDRLLEAEVLDPSGFGGSIPTSLGSLYFQVPGWPLGFGDDEKAEQYLKKALAIDPNGIDANYFDGLFLMKKKSYPEAKAALEKALAAPPRSDRALADEGRRKEIKAALAELAQKTGASAN
jgi:tetratricopeptide (TPR) repeat protein